MKIETRHIPSQGTTLRYCRAADQFSTLKELQQNGEYRFKDPLSIEFDVLPVQDVIEVSGRLHTTVQLTCSRCLADVTQVLNHTFQLIYSQTIPKELQGGDEQDAELTADQIGVVFYKGEVIDLSDALQEQVILALPYKPLCHERCKGLCAQCGVDLNHNACECKLKTPSGPFDALKGLKLPP